MGAKETKKTLQQLNWVRTSLTSKKSIMKVICALKTPTCILEQDYIINKQNEETH